MNSMLFDYAPPTLFDVRALWVRLWRRRLLVLLVTIAAVLAAIAYVATAKPSYVATTSILVDPRDIKSTNIDTVLPGIGTDSAAITSQVSIISSRGLLSDVYETLGLNSDPDFAASAGMLSSLFGNASVSGEERRFEQFRKSISVSREGLTYVINVSVKLGDPEKAALIANAIVERYIAGTTAEMTNAADTVNAALNKKIIELQNEVAAAELAVEAFKSDNNIFDGTTGGTLQSQIDQTAGQLVIAQDELAQLQSRYDQAVAIGNSPNAAALSSDISASPEIGRLRDQYNASAAALATASSTLGPRHPGMVQAQAELDSASRLLTVEAERFTIQLAADIETVKGKITRLQSDIQALRQRGDASNVAQIELRQLQARADASRTVLVDFLQRSQETSQIGTMQPSRVQIISRAVPPPEPVWPKPSLLLPVTSALGFLIGCGMALALADKPKPSGVSPSPQPKQPEPPTTRRTDQVSQPQTAVTTLRPSRRYASLSAAQREILGESDTPLTAAVQALVRDVLRQLPSRPAPFVLAFSGQDSARAMDIAAIGFARIGAQVRIESGLNSQKTTGPCDFIFVEESHERATHADVLVQVLGEARMARKPNHIYFALPLAEPPALALVAG